MSSKHIKTLGDDAETAIEFPTHFPIKAMGRIDDTIGPDHLCRIVVDIARRHAPDFDESTLTTRASAKAHYLSVTVTINATSKAQLNALYEELSAHPQIIMVF